MGSEAGSNAPADRRVYAGSDATAPAVPADLTPQWATEAMRAAGTIGDTEKVTAMASHPAASALTIKHLLITSGKTRDSQR